MPGGSDETRWLRPPGQGEVRARIAVGGEAESGPDLLRQALDSLARAVEEAEVQGYSSPDPHCPGLIVVNCPSKDGCTDYSQLPAPTSTCPKQYVVRCQLAL